jgi:LmbE family N-acetylglucosaminyl deacetylase/O-antigen/teichoic acid export membrane protein
VTVFDLARPVAGGRGRHRSGGLTLPGSRWLTARLSGDHLLTNSLYLMVNTIAMAVLGFVFWLVAARLYSPGQIGAGTTLISASGLLGLAGMLGLNNSLVRYLPTSARRSAHINTALLLVMVASGVLACGYLLIIPWAAPKLSFARDSPLMFIGFVLFTAGTALNQLTDSIFIAYRSARFNFLIDGGLQSGGKIVLILLFQGFGAYGVFASAGTAAGIAVVVSVLVLVRRFDYRPKLEADREALGEVAQFAGGNYVVSLLNLSPVLLLPIIVVDRLGTASAGYFYIAFMIANVVFAAAYAVSQSLFAEASYGERQPGDLARRATRILLVLLVPAGAVLALGSHLLMLPFGHAYSENGAATLAVLGLSAPIVGVLDICGVLMRSRGQLVRYVALNVVFAVSVIGLTLLWTDAHLVGVAWAWLTGNAIAAAAGLVLISAGSWGAGAHWSPPALIAVVWRWALVRRSRDATQTLGTGRLLVLAPHPDDEILGCGALIARAQAGGHSVHVVVATDGSMSSPASKLLPPPDLGRIRAREMQAAREALGLPQSALAGLQIRDGQLERHLDELVAAIKDILVLHRPDRLFLNSRDDPHPDHQALNRAAMLALAQSGLTCEVYEYPIWQWVRGPVSWQFGLARSIAGAWRSTLLLRHRPARVSTAGFLDAKRRSMAAYASQTTNLTGEADWQWLDEGFLAQFLTPRELFFRRTPVSVVSSERVAAHRRVAASSRR